MPLLPPALLYSLLELVDLIDHPTKALNLKHRAQDVSIVRPVPTP